MYLSTHDSSCHPQTENGIFNNQNDITSRITDNGLPTIESNHNREKEKEPSSPSSLDTIIATNYTLHQITTRPNNTDQYSGTTENNNIKAQPQPLTHQPSLLQNTESEQPKITLEGPISPSTLEIKNSSLSTLHNSQQHHQELAEEEEEGGNEGEDSQPRQSQQHISKLNNNETDRKPLSRLSPTSTSRLAIPKVTPYRGNSGERSIIPRYPSRTLNRLEVENAYLSNQNNTLNKDIQHCRQTVQALKSILAQKEEMIDKMRQEFQQTYLKTRLMERILQGQQNQDLRKVVGQSRGESNEDELAAFIQGFEDPERGRSGGRHSGYIINQFNDEDDEDEDEDEDEEEYMDDDENEDEEMSEDDDDLSDESETVNDIHRHGSGDYQGEGSYSGNSNNGKLISNQVAPSERRFRELNLNMVSHTNHISSTLSNDKFKGQDSQLAFEGSSSTSTLQDPQQNLDPNNNQRQGAGSNQVIRRRPRLQIGSVTSDKPSLMPSTPIAAFKDSITVPPLSIKIPVLRPQSPSSQSGSETENDSDDQVENTSDIFSQPSQLVYRDSGHFQNENFLWDDNMNSSKFDYQGSADVAHQTNPADMQFELVCISDSLVFTSSSSSDSNCEDDDEVANTMNNAKSVSSDSFRNSNSQQNNRPYLGDGPSAAPGTTLGRIHLEASASSSTLTIGSADSHEDSEFEAQGHSENNANDRSATARGSHTASISPEGSLESDMDEDRSESSMTTTSTSTPLTTTFEQSDSSSTDVERKPSLEVLHSYQQDEKMAIDHQEKSIFEHEGVILLVDNPLVVREESLTTLRSSMSSKLKGKGGFNRARGRSFTQSLEWTMNKSESLDDSTLGGAVSNSISSNSVSTYISRTKTIVGSTEDGFNIVVKEETKGQRTIFSRILSGFGKHVSGLMTGGRQSPEGRKGRSGKKPISAELEDRQGAIEESRETRPSSPGSNNSSDILRNRSSEQIVFSKGIGIRRLVRQKPRSQVNTTVSVNATDSNTAAAMTT